MAFKQLSGDLQPLLNRLQQDPQFIRNVTAWRTLPARSADPQPWPEGLDARLSLAGRQFGISSLYTHQLAAIQAVLHGDNVVLASGTASGKTLSYVLPLLNTLLHDPNATALTDVSYKSIGA